MDATARYLNLNPKEAQTAAAIFNRLFPADAKTPNAVDMGVLDFLDRALSGAYQDKLSWYRQGLSQIDAVANQIHGRDFAASEEAQQDALLTQLENGKLANFSYPLQAEFFAMLLKHMREGIFSDPMYGGN